MLAKKETKVTFFETFFISGFAAIISKTIAAPIERLKLLLQNQSEMLKQGNLDKPYKNTLDCLLRTYRNEGILSFWRGNLANCIRYFPTQALNFAFKDRIFKKRFQIKSGDSQWNKLAKNVLAGGLAGSISLPLVYSLDYARTRLSNDILEAGKSGKRQFSGLVDVYVKTYTSDGIIGLHRGFFISLVAMFLYRGAYFGIYDTVKPIISKGNPSFVKNFLLGYSITVFAGLALYPFDSIRRRMMMRQIVRAEGFGALMKGAGINIFRGIAGAGVLSFFDKFMQIYAGIKINTSGA